MQCLRQLGHRSPGRDLNGVGRFPCFVTRKTGRNDVAEVRPCGAMQKNGLELMS